MISHGKQCTHCGGNMSLPKPVVTGPRKGQTQSICAKCGHIDYRAEAQPANPADSPSPGG